MSAIVICIGIGGTLYMSIALWYIPVNLMCVPDCGIKKLFLESDSLNRE